MAIKEDKASKYAIHISLPNKPCNYLRRQEYVIQRTHRYFSINWYKV